MASDHELVVMGCLKNIPIKAKKIKNKKFPTEKEKSRFIFYFRSKKTLSTGKL